MNQTSLKLPSFAKINWNLRVLGKRPDGYHEVVTVLQTVSLRDELTLERRDDDRISLTCNDPAIPTDASNLIIKAGLTLREKIQRPLGADINLAKMIPAKGGLGGASSNAAVTLLGLNSLWQTKLKSSDLVRLGSGLGADVPFFFVAGRAAAKGIGAESSALPDAPNQQLIIITPNAAVSTAMAYASLNARALTTSDSASILSSSFAEQVFGDCDQWPLHNDFEGVIFEMEPEIKRVKLALLEAGARGALLAGSGSSVFGIFDNEKARDRALGNLRCEPGWRVFSCDTLSRVEYFQAMGSSGFPLFTLS